MGIGLGLGIQLGLHLGLGLILVSVRRQPISYINIRSLALRTENSEDATICYMRMLYAMVAFIVRTDGK